MSNLKQSIDQYRNIKGKSYQMWTAAVGEDGTFAEEIQKAQEDKKSYRIIDGQFYRERRDD